jgi:mono/diheme cytochrome c family protein
LITCLLLLAGAAVVDRGRCLRAEQPASDSSPAWSAAELEYFETRVRPVLVEHCQSCHNSTGMAEGDLVLDHRAALRAGGSSGPALVPGDPKSSRLIAVIRHQIAGLEMPQGGPKLSSAVIADLEQWIAMGAPDPRDEPPAAGEIAAQNSWESILQRRKTWWSLQPIVRSDPPASDGSAGNDIDRFIAARLSPLGLQPSPRAEPAVLIRRLFLTLIGLPPTPEQVDHWQARLAAAEPDEVSAELVDELLSSAHFGERWARHWMDWIRYAESHGSEGDPPIDNAWQYRDYLIRALNADVPFDQLVREHVAGDLLERPRVNTTLGINESAIGPAHWRMVFHGFAPTDALDEKVRFVDDQVNAFTKAFLGLTVSCARCHDHKFDAVSQRDYYALFGILASCRPGRTVVDLPDRQLEHHQALAQRKDQIRVAIASDWRAGLESLPARLLDVQADAQRAHQADSLLGPLARVDGAKAGDEIAAGWQHWLAGSPAAEPGEALIAGWDLAQADALGEWYRHGIGLPPQPSPAGEFAIAASGLTALTGIYPQGVYTHAISAKHPARLTSPDFTIAADSELWIHTLGDGGASVRYVIQDYPRSGTVYPVSVLKPAWGWQRFDLSYWQGDSAHVELTTGKDAPLLDGGEDRSWFGVREVRLVSKGAPAPRGRPEFLAALAEATLEPPCGMEAMANIYVAAITSAIDAWQSASASNAQADLLNACLQAGLLPNELARLPTAAPLIVEYRLQEDEIPVPTRVPGLDETRGRSQSLLVRGNHKQPGEQVPRRFLEVIDPSPYDTAGSGRLQLAEDLLRDDNPLTRRVIVNRVWHHLFGRGIVSTPDNLGSLGAQPSHPELLDWLAAEFVAEGWSLKRLIRSIVTSRTWQQSSRPSRDAARIDPQNLYLSHASVRRLEAEVIRDSLLAATGQLDLMMFGRPVAGASRRRSCYVQVIRNELDPFLRVFDFPEPFSATGRRDVTNVPAQSLTMMNDPHVAALASDLASSILRSPSAGTDGDRLERLFVTLFGRPPSAEETALASDFLSSAQQRGNHRQQQLDTLQEQLAQAQAQLSARLDPARQRWMEQFAPQQPALPLPEPIARWEFDRDLRDGIGNLHGQAHAGARLVDGALLLESAGYVTTAPIERSIRAKTLQVWVRLDRLQQRGGGAITLQTRNGEVFDSIVFGEAEPGHWMAGSDRFQRTQSFGGPAQEELPDRAVQMTIVYHADGRIIGYRDGEPYGRPYQSDGPVEFQQGDAIVSFGLRHLPAGGNRLLSGRIERAELYARALGADEVAAMFASHATAIPEAELLAALSDQDRRAVESLRAQIADLQEQLATLGPPPLDSPRSAAWTELVRALLTLQEFVYVR